jgi:PhnB protein
MQINPYLHFSGDCAEAFAFYAKLLGAKVDMMTTFGESPMAGDVPADWKGKVMHAQMKAPDGLVLMGTDAPPAYFKKPQGFSVSLTVNQPTEAERIYTALADRGQVTMELQKTFWAEKFGMLTDRFGTPWIVNCPSAS